MLINQRQIGPRKTIFKLNVASFDPSQIAHTQSERFKAGILFWVLFGEAKQYANPPHPFELLRPCNERPRHHCTAQ